MDINITYELAKNIVIYGSWVLGLWILLMVDGCILSIKGIELFSEEYEYLDWYDKLSYHVFLISRIAIIVIIIFGILYCINTGIIKF